MKYQLVPLAIFIASLFVPLCVMLWVRHQRRGRRSPLTVQLLRSPGESLARKIGENTEESEVYLMILSIMPLFCYSLYLSIRFLGNQEVSWIIIFLFCVVIITYFSFKLASLMKVTNNLRLGLDCERAVGQELNQLMLDGYRVFHDFPAEDFNIDHVVIGANGVFAVETKGRAKSLNGDVNIIFDGKGLHFPTHYEKAPIEQAKRQAEWFAKWLSSAVGEQVTVKPVLVFPGWFIVIKKRGLHIYNGKNPRSLYKNFGDEKLSAEMIQRIAHQVEQRCRDVEAVAFKKLRSKNSK